MTLPASAGIPYRSFPSHLQLIAREKTRLVLEANRLRLQQQFRTAADHFAQAARYEQQLADWADMEQLRDLSYLHRFSAVSCWAQAGDPYRALLLIQQMLTIMTLNQKQYEQLQAFRTKLEGRMIEWMGQWTSPELEYA